jgi:hypothetical protein
MAQDWRATVGCRVIACIAAVLPLLLMLVLARHYPDLNGADIPDWRPIISLADESSSKGDLDQARHLYLQAGRAASWRQDWAGLVAAACHINRLDGTNGPYARAFSFLIQASAAAELGQSRPGVATVAKSLSLLGADNLASAVLGRIQPTWPTETASVDDRALLEGCSAITAMTVMNNTLEF